MEFTEKQAFKQFIFLITAKIILAVMYELRHFFSSCNLRADLVLFERLRRAADDADAGRVALRAAAREREQQRGDFGDFF